MWDGHRIVSEDWVKQSLTPLIDASRSEEESYKYGFKWWLFPATDAQGYIWMARGFGGQRLMVFPEKDLIVVFTGWDILGNPPTRGEFVRRILPAVRRSTCGAVRH
jgi:CubicO group peptidase (beta-lactamase class C family)